MSDYLENAEMKMMTALENLESNLRTIRTGRANAQILDRVQVDYWIHDTDQSNGADSSCGRDTVSDPSL